LAVFGPRGAQCTTSVNGATSRYTVKCPPMPAALLGHTPFVVYLLNSTGSVLDTFQRNVIITGPMQCGKLTIPDQIVEGQTMTVSFEPDATVSRSMPQYNLTIDWGDGQQTQSAVITNAQYSTTHVYGGFFDAQTIKVTIDHPLNQFANTKYYTANSPKAVAGLFPFFSPSNGFYISGDFYYSANENSPIGDYYYLGSKSGAPITYYNQQKYYKNYAVSPRVAYVPQRCSMPFSIKRVQIVNSPPIIEPLSDIVNGQIPFGQQFIPPVLTIYDNGVGDTHTVQMQLKVGATNTTMYCVPSPVQAGIWTATCPTLTLGIRGINAVSFNVTDNNGAADYVVGYLNVN